MTYATSSNRRCISAMASGNMVAMRLSILQVGFLTLLALMPPAVSAATTKGSVYVCKPSIKYYFDINGAEEDYNLGDFKTTVNTQTGIMSRCGGTTKCDNYPVNVSQSGIYTNVQTKSPTGMMMKISSSLLYMELVTINFDTIGYYGKCTKK